MRPPPIPPASSTSVSTFALVTLGLDERGDVHDVPATTVDNVGRRAIATIVSTPSADLEQHPHRRTRLEPHDTDLRLQKASGMCGFCGEATCSSPLTGHAAR